jgi:hypothetical protein
MNNRKNIFERLFNDAEIKRISYRRSCHFSNEHKNKNNKNNNNNMNKTYLTLNNTSLNSSNFSKLIDENCDRTYQNSYVFKNQNNKLKNCTFRPNIKSFNFDQFAKPKIIKQNNENYMKTTNKSNSYVTLRDRINNFKYKNKRINNLMINPNNNLVTENIIKESNSNNKNIKISDISNFIYNLLKKTEHSELNSNTLKLDKIPNNIISIIIDIVDNISKKNNNYNQETFLKEFENLYNNLDDKDKKTLNDFYNLYNNNNKSTNLKLFLSINNNKSLRNTNQNTFNFFNQSKKINSSREIKNKSYLDSGTEKKRNFYYIF